MSAFIDFQGFQEEQGLFVLKELAIQPLSSRLSPISKIFKPPCDRSQLSEKYQETVSKCEMNHHGISWEQGCEEYNDISSILNQSINGKFEYLFVKGEDKKKWLKLVLREIQITIFNLDDLNCPDIKTLEEQHPAIRHSRIHVNCLTYKCSVENAQRLKSWYSKTFSTRPSLNKSIIHYCAVDNINDLAKAEISSLPIMAIIKFGANQIDQIWDKLSEKQQMNKTILGLRKCKQHPLQNDYEDEIGLFLQVAVKDCTKCKESSSNENYNM